MKQFILRKQYLWEVGGLNAVLYAIRDKVLKSDYCYQYMQRVYAAMDPEDYAETLRKHYRVITGNTLNLEKPRSFNEKIQWIKLNDITPLMTKLTDKYLVRDWVKEKMGEKYLIPILGVWDSFDEIDFNSLPNKFVLKCNHGSDMNLVVKDKNKLDMSEAKRLFDQWMMINYAFVGGRFELQYKDIPRKIIAEEYIEQMDGELVDYKIHVFGGEPRIIQIIGKRDHKKNTAKEAFFDLDWNRRDWMYHTYDAYETAPPRPDSLDDMLQIAKVLGADFRYVRVDLCDICGEIKFGEMTFTPASGFGKWEGDEQYLVGSWIEIPAET